MGERLRALATRFALLCIAASAVACTSSRDDALRVAEGGIGGTGISFGRIARNGEVVVNGTRFDLTEAEILLDGASARVEDLRTGMVATVIAPSIANVALQRAVRVTAQPRVAGPIEGIDTTARMMTVLGQRIRFDAGTVFVGTTPAALSPGDLIRVSGFPDADEGTLATRVERFRLESAATRATVQLRSRIRDHDSDRKRMTLGSVEVDYTDAAVTLIGVDRIAVGRIATVRGVSRADGLPVRAQSVSVQRNVLDGIDSDLSIGPSLIEGVVNRIAADGSFAVNGLKMVPGAELDVSGLAAPLRSGALVLVACRWEKGRWIAERLSTPEAPSY